MGSSVDTVDVPSIKTRPPQTGLAKRGRLLFRLQLAAGHFLGIEAMHVFGNDDGSVEIA
jgi:hypothetical protein